MKSSTTLGGAPTFLIKTAKVGTFPATAGKWDLHYAEYTIGSKAGATAVGAETHMAGKITTNGGIDATKVDTLFKLGSNKAEWPELKGRLYDKTMYTSH